MFHVNNFCAMICSILLLFLLQMTMIKTEGTVRNFTVYSKGPSYLRIHWTYDQGFVLNKTCNFFINYDNNKDYQSQNLFNGKNCTINPKLQCTRIEKLIENTNYSLEIMYCNYSLFPKSYVTTKISESEPPNNLGISWQRKHVELTWDHPMKTNGDIEYFQIEIKSELNATMKPEQENATYSKTLDFDFKPSTSYTFNVYAFNGLKGKQITKTVTSPSEPIITFNKTYSFIKVTISYHENVSFIVFVDNDYVKCDDETIKNSNNVVIKPEQNECFINYELNSNIWLNLNKTSFNLTIIVTYKYGNVTDSIEINPNRNKNQTNNNNDQENTNSVTYPLIFSILVTFLVVVVIGAVIYFIKRCKRIKYNVQNLNSSNANLLTDNIELTEYPPQNPVVLTCNSNIFKNADIKIDKSSQNKLNETNQLDHSKFSKKINVIELETYLQKSLESDDFFRLHQSLPQKLLNTCNVATSPLNMPKNRYPNVLAYDHTRVILKRSNDDNASDYINANYIDSYEVPKAYIATQAPKSNTLNDFWHMIWQENVKHIVMLANNEENKKDKYWPNINETIRFQDIYIEFVSNSVYLNYEERYFNVTYKGLTKKIHQLHFTAWPNHATPIYAHILVPFMKNILKFRLTATSPILIHCSGGIGRTGLIILADICLQMASKENAINPLKYLHKMRTQRPHMVDSVALYQLAHFVIVECLMGLDTSIQCADILNATVDKMEKEKIFLELKYLRECAWKDDALKMAFQEGRGVAIVPEKNRVAYITPEPQAQVVLAPLPGNDAAPRYINAIFVDGFTPPTRQFIVSQYPMRETMSDFWRMVYQEKINVIVTLNEHDDDSFMPSSVALKLSPNAHLSVVFDSEENYYFYREINVILNYRNELNRRIQIIALNGWIANNELPASAEEFVSFWYQSHLIIQPSSTVLVTCFDGATASGLYLAAYLMYEKMILENSCDVCEVVRTVRHNRKHFVQTEEQFAFLYLISVIFEQHFRKYFSFS